MRILLTILPEKKRNMSRIFSKILIGRTWNKISRTPYENNNREINQDNKPPGYGRNSDGREEKRAGRMDQILKFLDYEEASGRRRQEVPVMLKNFFPTSSRE